jgi:1-deoxy-D-xylulose-5-phosphate reductoisomerase
MASGAPFLELAAVGRLDFCAPDPERFPSLRLAQAAAREGGVRPAILNAANEIAVQAFLDRQLNFNEIPAVTEAVLEAMPGGNVRELDQVLAVDTEARMRARDVAGLHPTGRSAIA